MLSERALRLQASTAQEQKEVAADEGADMEMDDAADMDMEEDDGVAAPSEAVEAKSEFDGPAEADGPMKIVKHHVKPGEAEGLGGKSAATGVALL